MTDHTISIDNNIKVLTRSLLKIRLNNPDMPLMQAVLKDTSNCVRFEKELNSKLFIKHTSKKADV